MSRPHSDKDLARLLSAYGSELSRWPELAAEAKAALLKNPEFRRAWESERSLDQKLAMHRDALDDEMARSGGFARLRKNLVRRSAGPISGLAWRRVAAGVLIAGMLGGALDLMLPERPAEPIDVALVDPLSGFDVDAE